MFRKMSIFRAKTIVAASDRIEPSLLPEIKSSRSKIAEEATQNMFIVYTDGLQVNVLFNMPSSYETSVQVEELELVWISHRHIDHTMGLPGIVIRRSPRLTSLTMVSP